MNRALFLDRDGVINVDKSYVYKFEDVEWMPGVIDLIKIAHELNLKVIVLTNQSGIDRGYYQEADVHLLHEQMNSALNKFNAHIDGWYYCSKLDSPDRKPNPGMMIKAQKEHNIDLTKSFMVGDKESDILNLEGPEYLLIKGNYDLRNIPSHIKIFSDLFEIREYIISCE